MTSREAFIALNMVEGVGPVRVRQLVQFFGNAPAILSARESDLQKTPGIGADTARAIASWESSINLEKELKAIEDHGCHVLIQDDENYPALLKQIYDPPLVLYVKGDLRLEDRNSIALVGSRQTTSYGNETARRFGFQLAQAGITVVSGGARGIDTSAHQGALAGQGRTIAVLGTGINIIFPPENKSLFDRIAAQGAVVTQFPFNRPADKQSFPIRNRIVAGMTLGTVVIEANLTSGALITANFAVEYGRQVFAVPGMITSPRSKGCHDLIKKGAKLCEGIDDILPEFEYLFPPPNRATHEPGTPMLTGLTLTENEQKIYDAVTDEETNTDEVIRHTGLPASAVAVGLLTLEMKRLIKQLPGKLFVRNR